MTFRRADYAEKRKNREKKQIAVATGYAMTQTTMCCFLMLGIVVRATIAVLRSAAIIITNNTAAIGKHAKNAKKVLSTN